MTDAEKTQFIAGVYGEEELLVHAARNAAELGEVVLQYRQAIKDVTVEYKAIIRDWLMEALADILISADQICFLEGFESKVRKIVSKNLKRKVEHIEVEKAYNNKPLEPPTQADSWLMSRFQKQE